ncbi:MAG: DUF2797 domain-containing protein [Bacteroidales bacterium]|nr:DUF2797 domain-containing protein [Bacteroidales bacterium]
MELNGIFIKMQVILKKPVEYYLQIDDKNLYINDLIGKKIKFKFSGIINCIKCGNITRKSYGQGYCYPCFISIPETDICIFRPELCQAHVGISRDMEWSKKHCLQEHYVYFAISSGLKVGVTRKSNVPERWIDQGAIKAIKIAKTPNRHIAGLIEVELKKHFADKTNWRHMLTNEITQGINLLKEKENVKNLLAENLKSYLIDDKEITEIEYPVKYYPKKVKSINFDKVNKFEGILTGIKGQYLLFEDGSVLNVRKHNGYVVGINY